MVTKKSGKKILGLLGLYIFLGWNFSLGVQEGRTPRFPSSNEGVPAKYPIQTRMIDMFIYPILIIQGEGFEQGIRGRWNNK